MNLNQFHREREEFDSRVRKLTESVKIPRAHAAAGASAQSIDLTRRLLDEIGVALEELAVAEEEMRNANEELLSSRDECEEERRKYRELFDFCPDAYIVSDIDGGIREANRAAADLFEARSEFLIGKPLLSFVLDEDRDEARRQLRDLLERASIHEKGKSEPPRIQRLQVRLQLRSRRVGVGSVNADVMLTDRGEPEGVRWMIRDVTREKECDAALELMRQQRRHDEQLCAIGTLAAGLGHDVKNLLFPVRCRLDALSSQQIAPTAHEDVEVVRQAIKYLQQLAANLQMLAERQDATAEPQPGRAVTHLASWWEHISPLLMASVRRQIAISSKIEQNLPPVAIPPHLLTQAVVNLVNNAGKAIANEGHIVVWADYASPDPPNAGTQPLGSIRVGVSDNGPGISNVERQRIVAQKAMFPGQAHGLSTGLGFPLVRSIVDQVGGSLTIDSEPGRGTTITLTFPAAADDPELADDLQFPDGPFAAVSLSDPHIASSMSTLLNLSRLPAVRTPPDEPGPCALWVTEPDLVSPARAKAFLESAPVRRLVMIGSQDAAGGYWQDVPAVWIQRPASPRTIREALSEVVHEVLHG